MSWPLASFLLVAVVLAVGWLAYERRRPSARTAAVVAVMAALAALGRDAFVALPDVKPITAMTLVVGYALGPVPGFTVGALGMLVSNFMLGQGPYTPWQMAAWGLVGLIGAMLGRLSGRRLGRVPLALACAFSALAAKEVMNFYTWTLGAVHTPAAFLAVAGQALSFDITDTVASFLFGLAFAPELARVLARMRVRMEVIWVAPEATIGPPDVPPGGRGSRSPLGVLCTLLAVVGAAALLVLCPRVSGAPASQGHSAERPPAAQVTATPSQRPAGAPASAARRDLSREISYLAAAQNTDGGFGGARGQSSSELYSGWVAIGLAAAGRDPLSVRHNGHTLLDALRGEASALHGAGDLERTILALHACGVATNSLDGRDPLAELLRFRDSDGSFSGQVNLTAFAIFALRAAGAPASDEKVRKAAAWIAREENTDGGFGFGVYGGPSDVDDTAAALQALIDAGQRTGTVLSRAVSFLTSAQNLDGGFPMQPPEQSNAQSTAWAIQGLVAAGRHPSTLRHRGSATPLGYLQGLIAPDGSVRYSRTSTQTPVWVTAQALTALALKPLPITPVKPPGRVASSPDTTKAPPTGKANPPATALQQARRSTAKPSSPRPAASSTGQVEDRLDAMARTAGALAGMLLAPILR
ncbi:MAG TPA: prenyltransferase/squalene oxidase repeat-containing protein [Solirubrobacteraceae bacterium]|jgi:energy-coupling factor transport system substrate-specific component